MYEGLTARSSPPLWDVCRYYPACSAYALEALDHHGAMRGLSLTGAPYSAGVPWATGGIDPVPEGKRTFAPGAEPKIILLNHPHLYNPHTGGDAVLSRRCLPHNDLAESLSEYSRVNIFDLILWLFKWIVSVVLWLFHTLFHPRWAWTRLPV